jgi:hypothetical protein
MATDEGRSKDGSRAAAVLSLGPGSRRVTMHWNTTFNLKNRYISPGASGVVTRTVT